MTVRAFIAFLVGFFLAPNRCITIRASDCDSYDRCSFDRAIKQFLAADDDHGRLVRLEPVLLNDHSGRRYLAPPHWRSSLRFQPSNDLYLRDGRGRN
jgi:hypothetical protein